MSRIEITPILLGLAIFCLIFGLLWGIVGIDAINGPHATIPRSELTLFMEHEMFMYLWNKFWWVSIIAAIISILIIIAMYNDC